jgi:hypothetical protein
MDLPGCKTIKKDHAEKTMRNGIEGLSKKSRNAGIKGEKRSHIFRACCRNPGMDDFGCPPG